MARLIAGFLIFLLILGLLNTVYPGRIMLRYLLILLIVAMLLYSSAEIAYLLGGVGDPTLTAQAQGTAATGGTKTT